jgi:hypothetical protein
MNTSEGDPTPVNTRLIARGVATLTLTAGLGLTGSIAVDAARNDLAGARADVNNVLKLLGA